MNKYFIFLMFLILSLSISGCTADSSHSSNSNTYEKISNSFNGLETYKSSEIIYLEDGSTYNIVATKIIKEINDKKYVMYGYNGQIPGPTLRVKRGSTVKINFTNNLNDDTTIHWHGLRHNYKDDGVPFVSQDPVSSGDSFTYTLTFPDSGVFWYHPHIREDVQQDLGLYGNIIVDSNDINTNSESSDFDKEIFLMLDDILIEEGKIVSYGSQNANYALMGRYGNVMLTNGLTDYELKAEKGEVIRLYITLVSNVRPFNFSISGTKLKLVGGDIGLYAHEEFKDSIIIGPAERYIVDVRFEDAGIYSMNNVNPWKTHELGKILVSEDNYEPKHDDSYNTLEKQNEVSADISKYESYFNKPIDKTLNLGIDIDHGRMMGMMMHGIDNIEWEDFMAEENHDSNSKDIEWYIEDQATGMRNEDIIYEFSKGDIVKMKFINNIHSPHPMQHSIHLHGQRFLVLEENGVKNTNLVWKDTFLITTGGTTIILMDTSNPGKWMMHCHIAEHLESGMMGMFEVSE